MSVDVNSPEIVGSADTQTQTQRDDREINFERLRKKTEGLESAIRERDELLNQQRQALENLQERMKPQEEEESYASDDFIDESRFQKRLEKERKQILQEAENIARQTYAKIDSENYGAKLKSLYPDYDQVVTESNASKLQDLEPEYVELLGEVKDNFKRREMAYKKLKKLAAEAPKVKAQDVVDENKKASASYFTPSGQGPMTNPYAFEFDVRNKDAKAQAYAKLKAAQKRG